MSNSNMFVKQVIVARTDLELSPGKLAAQVAHASVNASESVREENPDIFEQWMNEEHVKIVLAGDDAEHLRTIQDAAGDAGVPHSLIRDAGYTEIEEGTLTAVALGPEDSDLINQITGNLSLYPK